ncbi:hypothetical protein [Paraburkholderia youngii]|uniref:hypothetical protein n=1 Tax=Paraburkholderia youngii TaxID=2782701 RepID=UPI003D1F3D24
MLHTLQSLIENIDLLDKVVGGFLAFFVSTCGYAIRYHRAAIARERAKGVVMTGDIEFMLAVEAQYRAEEKLRSGHDPQVRVRKLVKEQLKEKETLTGKGVTWSGLYTPGRVASANAARGMRVKLRRIAAVISTMREVDSTSASRQ